MMRRKLTIAGVCAVLTLVILAVGATPTDDFPSYAKSLTGPANDGQDFEPGDTLTHVCRAVYVGTGGDIRWTLSSGTELLSRNVADGTLMPYRVIDVSTNGTTASHLQCVW